MSEIEGQEARYTTSVDFSSLYDVCYQTIGLLGISLLEDDHSFAVFMSNCTCITCSAVFDNQEEREKYPMSLFDSSYDPSQCHPFQIGLAQL